MTAGRTLNTLSRDWGTPGKYVAAIRKFFDGRICLDPCSNLHSIVGAEIEYRLPKHDGLHESWNFPSIYVNPPYGVDKEHGTSIKAWLKRSMDAHYEYNSEVLALVPVATNTGHWKKYVFGKAAAVCFLYDTRLKFLVNGKDGGKGAPMSCAIIYWGAYPNRFIEMFERFGATIDITQLHGRRIGVDGIDAQMELQLDCDVRAAGFKKVSSPCEPYRRAK